MRTIRLGVFETNSSSTHTMAIMSEDEYKQWKSGEILRFKWDDKFVSKEESEQIIQKLKEQYAKEYNIENIEDIDIYDIEEDYSDDIPLNFEDYDDWKYLENDVTHYTTQSGDKLVIVCWYGNEY